MSTLLLDASVILAAFDSDDDLHGSGKGLASSPADVRDHESPSPASTSTEVKP